jgi:UDP-N-acetylmuramoyl-tripeptide--D-alanyl-D-alanine ligase
MTNAAVAAGLPSMRAVPVTDKAEAVAIVTSDLAPGDVVLVKASRGLALDTVADEILAAVGLPPHRDAV